MSTEVGVPLATEALVAVGATVSAACEALNATIKAAEGALVE
jgi:hypothetical protein